MTDIKNTNKTERRPYKKSRRSNSDPLDSLWWWKNPGTIATVAYLQDLSKNQVRNHCYGLLQKGLLREYAVGWCHTADRMGVKFYVAVNKIPND